MKNNKNFKEWLEKQPKECREYVSELIKEKEKFETLAETSPDCIKLFDEKLNLLYINEGGLEEHGLESLEKAQKEKWYPVKTFKSQDRPKFKRAFKKAVEKGESSTIELNHTPEGSDREICLETIVPVKDERGKTIGIFGVSRDISNLKKLQSEILSHSKELKKINEILTGREMRMIKLKKEVNELKEKLGENPKYNLEE